MAKIFRVLLVLALVAAVIGYFRAWYTVTRVDVEQQTNIIVQINRQRIKEDLDLAAQKARGLADGARSDSGEPPATESSDVAPTWPQ